MRSLASTVLPCLTYCPETTQVNAALDQLAAIQGEGAAGHGLSSRAASRNCMATAWQLLGQGCFRGSAKRLRLVCGPAQASPPTPTNPAHSTPNNPAGRLDMQANVLRLLTNNRFSPRMMAWLSMIILKSVKARSLVPTVDAQRALPAYPPDQRRSWQAGSGWMQTSARRSAWAPRASSTPGTPTPRRCTTGA
jgi:hypothetical protein